jgi:hypothetical protein
MFLGFLGGIIAWLATSLVGQPVLEFLAARNEAARALARYEGLDSYQPDEDESPCEDADARRKLLADAGSRLVAFGYANQPLSKILRRLRFHPQSAGGDLLLLSEMRPYGGQNDQVRQKAMRALRLGRLFSRNHRM